MTPVDTGGFAVMLDERGADEGEVRRRRLARIVPHLSAAFELSQLAVSLSAKQRQLQTLLEAMPIPAFVLDGSGLIERINNAAERLLGSEQELAVAPGPRLTAAGPTNRAVLADMIAAALGPEPATRLGRLS